MLRHSHRAAAALSARIQSASVRVRGRGRGRESVRGRERESEGVALRALAATSSSSSSRDAPLSLSLSLSAAVLAALALSLSPSHCDTPSEEPLPLNATTQDDTSSLPVYRLSEVAAHNSVSRGVWLVLRGEVFDATRFLANHPGGREKLLLAAGGDLEPYWNVYRQHWASSAARETLQSLRIGRLHPDDLAAMQRQKQDRENDDNPYKGDPVVSPVMRVLQREPINAQPPQSLLRDAWVTPIGLWFVRNHHPVPPLALRYCKARGGGADEEHDKTRDEYNITLSYAQDLQGPPSVSPSVSLSLSLSLTADELRRRFPSHTVVSTLQCGGNRRAEMTALSRTNGANWDGAAISTAAWTGARLRDVLASVGVTEDAVFGDYDDLQVDLETGNISPETGPGDLSQKMTEGSNERVLRRVRHLVAVSEDGLEASIPIRKALSRYGDALLAYEMNGEPLPAVHGGPIRLIVPGHVGVRNVKWVRELRLSAEEAHGTWQRGMAYKGFGPSVKSLEGLDVASIPSLQEQPVTSIVTHPHGAAPLTQGERNTVQGYAYSGGGRGIVRVDVSIDGGKTWKTATLTEGASQPLDRAWAWTFWECDFDIPDGPQRAQYEVICKATDAAHNVQPDTVQGVWNLRGINNNAWHRVLTEAVPAPEEDDDE